jgi:hypothetical protein
LSRLIKSMFLLIVIGEKPVLINTGACFKTA